MSGEAKTPQQQIRDAIKGDESLIKELDKMQDDLAFLDCLVAAGVDNWDGYSDAQEMMEVDD